MYTYKGKVIRVIDGDTVDIDIDLGFKLTINLRLRLAKVNTPERGRPDYTVATNMLTDLINQCIDTDGYIYVKTEKTGKYGRWIAYLGNKDNSTLINDELSIKWPYET